jgi:hypothetical protein
MRPQDLTTAKTVAKIGVVSNTAGERRAWHADPQVLTIPRLQPAHKQAAQRVSRQIGVWLDESPMRSPVTSFPKPVQIDPLLLKHLDRAVVTVPAQQRQQHVPRTDFMITKDRRLLSCSPQRIPCPGREGDADLRQTRHRLTRARGQRGYAASAKAPPVTTSSGVKGMRTFGRLGIG